MMLSIMTHYIICVLHILDLTSSCLFFQIESHWSSNISPEMTLEKLQLIATCNVSKEHKVKWLVWWNSSIQTREARRFPLKPMGETELKSFLAKACFYVGVCASSSIDVYSIHPVYWSLCTPHVGLLLLALLNQL